MLRVDQAGLLVTVQDLGRPGYQHYGVPVSGALDAFALRAANLLVGNAPDAAGLEVGLGGLTLTALADGVWSITGAAPLAVTVNDQPRPLWTALYVRARQTLQVHQPAGGWAYLAVRGGLAVPLVLGARATYLRGGFGGWQGRPLQAGDRLPIGSPPDGRAPADLAGRTLAASARPVYGAAAVVEVVLGPQSERFHAGAEATFLASEYAVRVDSDRMGYRLDGPAVPPDNADLISEGMPVGAIQVPADGRPILMLADGPPTGGYPKIATVARADLPLVAQCPPGQGQLRFRAVAVADAQAKYRAQLAALRHIEDPDTWPG